MYLAFIDLAQFGLIADYLRSPRSPIEYLLHVSSKAMLTSLAEQIGPEHKFILPRSLLKGLQLRFHDGSLLISSRHFLDQMESKVVVEATTIPRHVPCSVIYLPPYYLVHTPGLFEGTLVRQKVDHDEEMSNQMTPKMRLKL